MNFLKVISNSLKKLLPGHVKTQLEAGFRNEQLELTKAGRFALLEVLSEVDAYRDALTARANEIVAERKAEEEKNK